MNQYKLVFSILMSFVGINSLADRQQIQHYAQWYDVRNIQYTIHKDREKSYFKHLTEHMSEGNGKGGK